MKKTVFLILTFFYTIDTVLAISEHELIAQYQSWQQYSFENAMYVQIYKQIIQHTDTVVGISGDALYDFAANLYEKNSPVCVPISIFPKIPKIIHQIWIGGEVPSVFKPFMESWTYFHQGPEWQYILWTDDSIAELGLYNQYYYDISDNPGVKSDLVKWELIYRFGGVYVDIDFECLRPLDLFHHQYDFYTAFQPLDTQYLQLGAALFGAVPGHPLLKHCVETISDDWDLHGIPAKTGPIHFTKSFYLCAGQDLRFVDIAFPAFYFYPLGCRQKELIYDEWISYGAYAIHHWAKSWMPPAYRLEQFKQLQNDEVTADWNY